MKDEILNKLEELNKVGSWISTNELLKELRPFGNPIEIVKELLKDKIIERMIEEQFDICSFRTTKFTRILKLKNLSK